MPTKPTKKAPRSRDERAYEALERMAAAMERSAKAAERNAKAAERQAEEWTPRTLMGALPEILAAIEKVQGG